MLTFLPARSLSWILVDLLQVIVLLIIVDVVRSWLQVMGTRNTSAQTPWVRTLHMIINPVLAPFRIIWETILNSFSRSYRSTSYALRRIDLSPFLAILAINIIQNVLIRI